MNLKNVISKIAFCSFKNFYALLILMVLLYSCDNQNTKVIIKGKISEVNKHDIILEELLPNKIDTVKMVKTDKNGTFEIKLDNLKDCFYRLKTDDANFIYLYLRNNDFIEINATFPEIAKNYSITGSKDCKLLKEINSRLIKSTDTINKMREILSESYYIKDFNIDSLRIDLSERSKEIFNEDKKFLTNFIKTNFESPVIYIALYQYIDTSPIFTMENDLEIFEFVLENLKVYNPELEQTSMLESIISKHKLRLQQITNNYSNLKAGDEAPDFSINNSKGEKISLYDFKGKTIIIYFWASWSKSSINNIENIVKLKEKNNDNLEILLFSLDSGPEKWKKAIASLNIGTLNNVSDFKIWESPIIKVYGINSIPTMVIVNADGVLELITQDFDIFTNKLNEIL